MAASFCWPAGPAARPAGGTWPSVPSRQACSYSAGGRPPVRRITRRVLYQPAHSQVAASTRAGVSHGPRWPVTSVLYRPMTDSASALSYESPTLPTDGAMPAAASPAPYRLDRYSLPASLLSRLRLNSDYAEVGVKPRNPGP